MNKLLEKVLIINIIIIGLFELCIIFDYEHIFYEHENGCIKCEIVEKNIEIIEKLSLVSLSWLVLIILKFRVEKNKLERKSFFTLVLMKVQANE